MKLTRYKLGDLVEIYSKQCGIPNLTIDDVSGVNKDKEFFEPSKQVGNNTSKYKIVPNGYFACNLMHVGRDRLLPIAFNHSGMKKIVSPAYTVFKLKRNNEILSEYFFMMLKSAESDRYFWFFTDSSVRDGMSWSDMCDIDIELPPIDIQQKYVDIYNGMNENINLMSSSIEEMHRALNVYMEDLLGSVPKKTIGSYISQTDNRNINLDFDISYVKGISIEKKFIETKANMKNVALNRYKLVDGNEFAYVPVTSRNGNKISLAMNQTDQINIVSSSYTTFKVYAEELHPMYLFMFLKRSEFDRYARFNSWGSARETIGFEDVENYKIPIPSKEIQQAIVNIFEIYEKRKRAVENLKQYQSNMCPILIKGAIEEAMG